MSPRFISGCPKRALSLATIRSHASANSRPPPSAKPLTAAMTGIGRSSKLSITRWPRREKSSPSTADIFAIAAISAPATKALSPAPVTMSTRTEGSCRTSRITRAISSSTSRLSAFSALGRFTVSVAIAALSKIIFLRSTLLIPPASVSVSSPRAAHSALAQIVTVREQSDCAAQSQSACRRLHGARNRDRHRHAHLARARIHAGRQTRARDLCRESDGEFTQRVSRREQGQPPVALHSHLSRSAHWHHLLEGKSLRHQHGWTRRLFSHGLSSERRQEAGSALHDWRATHYPARCRAGFRRKHLCG